MFRRPASLLMLLFCLFSLGACIVEPAGPYGRPGAVWVPGHWNRLHWVPGHWA